MACDMVVALGPATVNGRALFALHHYSTPDRPLLLRRLQGRLGASGETLSTDRWRIAEARQTWTVLGCGNTDSWGFTCGVNELHVAAGVAAWQSKLAAATTGLTGTDLVRLVLERGHSALHGVEVLTDLITRHGVAGVPAGAANGAVFLVADGQEAVVLEAAGHHWAMTSVHQVRAVGDHALIRQDWQRLSPGLAEAAKQNGWWPGGGSKLDFAGSLVASHEGNAPALKRWGRATLLLEQQNGHFDHDAMRRLLAEHYDAMIAPNARDMYSTEFLVELRKDAPAAPLAWFAAGPPHEAPYFPVLLDGDLPEIMMSATGIAPFRAEKDLDELQTRWDDAVENYEAHTLQPHDRRSLQRQATQLMHELAARLAVHSGRPPKHPAPTDSVGAAELAYVSE